MAPEGKTTLQLEISIHGAMACDLFRLGERDGGASRCLLWSVITVPWMLQYTSYYCCYNRISAGSSRSDVPSSCLALSNRHTHTHARHRHVHRQLRSCIYWCTRADSPVCSRKKTASNHTNKGNSFNRRIRGFSKTMCFGCVAADPILCGTNHFTQLLVSDVAVNCL